MHEPNILLISDTDESKEEPGSFSCEEETDSDGIPPSLLSYFETSKSRAAVCEKLISEELGDFTASHDADGSTDLPIELDEDMRKVNEQITCETENEKNMTDDEYMENENDLALEISEHEAQREKHHSEEVQKEEQRRQREMDFQQELRKIMEEEKLHQMKLELMKKRAQEKLEQELLLQQELICNLQKRVEYERRMIEEEWKRKKEEEAERKAKEKEERRKREEEDKRRRQEDRKEMEEEKKRKIIDMRLKEKEDKRKREEQRKRKEEYDEKRKSEEEKDKREREMRKKEEERKTQEIKFREEEMRRRVEEEINEGKEERRVEKSESRINWKTEKEETKEKEERLLLEVAVKKISQGEKRRNEHKLNPKNELRKMEGEEGKKRDEGEKRGEKELRIGKKTEVRTKREEEDEQKSEEERENGELERKSMDEDLIRMKDGSGKMEKKMQVRDDEGKKRDEEKGKSVEKKDMVRTEEEKTANTQTKWHEVEKKNKEEECRHTEEEIRLKQEIQDNKECAGDTREVEHERKEEDKDKWQDDLKKLQKKEDETKRMEADMRHSAEEVKEDKEEEMKMEEIGLKEETGDREGKKESEEERMLISENEVEEKKENNKLIFQNKKTGRTELWSSSSPGPSLSESTGSRTCSETVQNHLLDKNICPASACETMGQQESVIKCCTSSCSVPVCLPEHTEQKRLSWMKDCMPWSKLSLQNTRKQKGSVWSLRRPRKAAGASRLPPLCPNTLLQSSGFKSLQEVTTVTLEELPGCSLSTLVHCHQLRSLTLRRCGLKSLEGISQLQELCYIDLRENDISSVDCERMTSLRVLRLAHNKLTSIHGLSGADSLSVLDLSHNSITRIAGLESVSRLQRLSVDHNQLISTKGLRDVYTLLHLDCSHNHLTSVEGLENSALLHTLDLKSNSLTEPPSLNNQVLLREVHLDDNSISSLQGLAACWLPLLQNLSVAQNRITQLPSMIDFVSLENLDLRLNCLSELPNVCENLKGCHFLREVHLSGNPLQQERGWRSTLQKALPGLRAIDSQQTDSFLSVLPAQQVNMVPGCFLTFCQAQLQQTLALEQRHSKELGNASSPLDAVKSFCRHFTVAQKLAEDQRFAHEYGDTTASAEYLAEGHTTAEKELNIDLKTAESCIYYPEMDTNSKRTAVFPNKNNMRCSYSGYEETPAEESLRDTFDIVATDPRTGSAVSKTNSGTLPVFTSNGEKTSFSLDKVFVSSFHDLDLKNTAAVLIQRRWRKYRLKCGNVDPSIVEKEGEIRGDGEKPESGPSYINRSAAGRDYAATVIQAFWRGFTLRRRLAYALAAVTWPDAGEEDAFEEVDVEEFVFDEPALEKYWTVTFSEDSPPRHRPVSEQPLSQKPPVSSHDYSEYLCSPPLVQSPKQAWMAGQHVDSVVQRISPKSSNRDQSPAPSSVLSGLSERSEKILEEWGFTDSRTALLMLKRAQKMKSAKKQQKKNRNPSLGLAMFRKEARKSPAQYNRYSLKVGEAELGLQLAERTEQTRREQAQHRLHTQAAQSDRHSESEHFLPEINSSILNGGRVQLVADAACADRPHATGLWANSSLADQPGKVNTYSGRNSSGHARKEVASPKRVTSAPSKKERISFRDHPVQLSGGWGGGKKRDRLHK